MRVLRFVLRLLPQSVSLSCSSRQDLFSAQYWPACGAKMRELGVFMVLVV